MAVLVMNQLFTMIILMLVGVILNKKKYLSENDAKELSVILVKVAVPANMIILLQRPYSHEIFVEFLKVCAGTLGVCFIALDDAHDAAADVTATLDILGVYTSRLRQTEGAVPS